MHSIHNILCAVVALVITLSSGSALGAAERVYHLAPRSDGQEGQGTAGDPYDASSQRKFDRLMKRFPENSVIRLAPGSYFTLGQPEGTSHDTPEMWTVKSGWRIVGAGMSKTRIVLTNAMVPKWKYHIIAADNVPVQGVVIEDLCIDGNPVDGNYHNNRSGLYLRGSGNRVSRVKAVGWGSRDPASECFVIALYAHGGPATNNLVEDCVVTEPMFKKAGTGFTGIIQSTASADYRTYHPVIRRCWVDNVGGDPVSYANGYTIYHGVCGVIEDCVGYSIVAGAYWDSAGFDSVEVRNNQFINVRRGVFLNGAATNLYANELIIQGNLIQLYSTNVSSGYTAGFEVNGFGAGRRAELGRVTVLENKVEFFDAAKPLRSESYAGMVRGAKNVIIRDNAINLHDSLQATRAFLSRHNQQILLTNNVTSRGIRLAYTAEPSPPGTGGGAAK